MRRLAAAYSFSILPVAGYVQIDPIFSYYTFLIYSLLYSKPFSVIEQSKDKNLSDVQSTGNIYTPEPREPGILSHHLSTLHTHPHHVLEDSSHMPFNTSNSFHNHFSSLNDLVVLGNRSTRGVSLLHTTEPKKKLQLHTPWNKNKGIQVMCYVLNIHM
jgi:hypothetical protein